MPQLHGGLSTNDALFGLVFGSVAKVSLVCHFPYTLFISDMPVLTNSDSDPNDPNGEDEDTPAARSRYWNARPSSGTDNLLSLASKYPRPPIPSRTKEVLGH
jgi:hypothetical protein